MHVPQEITLTFSNSVPDKYSMFSPKQQLFSFDIPNPVRERLTITLFDKTLSKQQNSNKNSQNSAKNVHPFSVRGRVSTNLNLYR